MSKFFTTLCCAAALFLVVGCGEEEHSPLQDDISILTAAQVHQITQQQAYLQQNEKTVVEVHLTKLAVSTQLPVNSTIYPKAYLTVNPISQRVLFYVEPAAKFKISDAFIRYISLQHFVPYFQQNRAEEGVVSAMKLISEHISSRASSTQWATLAEEHVVKNSKSIELAKLEALPRTTPKAALKSLEELMLTAPETVTQLYAPKTQRMLLETSLNRELKAKLLSDLRYLNVEVTTIPKKAVAVFPILSSTRAPFFLTKDANGLWQVDLWTRLNAIAYTEANNWYFVQNPDGYETAFPTYKVDENGFLYKMSAAELSSLQSGPLSDKLDADVAPFKYEDDYTRDQLEFSLE